MFKSLALDDCIVAEINNRKLNLAESELPPDLRSKIIAIVEAPKWNEVSEGALATSSSLPTSEAILKGWPGLLGIIAIAAVVCGVVFGFLFESATIVYVCFTAAILSIGTIVVLQSRSAKGYAAVFGIAFNPDGELTREDFVKHQTAMAEILKAIAKVGSCMLLVLMVWLLTRIDKMTYGADDSVVAASIRSVAICLIPMTIWGTWNSWKKRGPVFQVARCLRGFLALNFSPFWVSWLYEPKYWLAKPGVPERKNPTIMQIVKDNCVLLAIFLFFVVCLANPQWLDGENKPQTPRHDSKGKARWVTHVVIWMFEHPTSTFFIGASLGSLSIAIFSHNLSKWTNPNFAGRIAIAIFFLSILLFAAIGRLHNG